MSQHNDKVGKGLLLEGKRGNVSLFRAEVAELLRDAFAQSLPGQLVPLWPSCSVVGPSSPDAIGGIAHDANPRTPPKTPQLQVTIILNAAFV